jgi:hypothetical protein
MSIKIFISHKKEDSKKAENVEAYIKKNYNFDVYVDTLDDKINSTINITDRIVDKLRSSTHLLVVFSEHTKESMWVPFELGVSYERNQGIGVLVWSDKVNIPYNLPEYLEDFPILKCNKKSDSDYCFTSDLNKYLDEIKKYSSVDLEYLTEGLENLTKETGYRNRTNYARTFIDNLKNKL